MVRTILGLLLAMLATGCMASSPSPHNVDDTDPRILVIYGNKEFEDKLLVIRKILDDSQRLARCAVTLQNVSQDTFVVEYQFRWMESSGMPIMQTPAWSRLTVSPNAVRPLVNVAKVPNARIVKFTVRLPMTAMYETPAK
jgi:uncharacterized protein YcfL